MVELFLILVPFTFLDLHTDQLCGRLTAPAAVGSIDLPSLEDCGSFSRVVLRLLIGLPTLLGSIILPLPSSHRMWKTGLVVEGAAFVPEALLFNMAAYSNPHSVV